MPMRLPRRCSARLSTLGSISFATSRLPFYRGASYFEALSSYRRLTPAAGSAHRRLAIRAYARSMKHCCYQKLALTIMPVPAEYWFDQS